LNTGTDGAPLLLSSPENSCRPRATPSSDDQLGTGIVVRASITTHPVIRHTVSIGATNQSALCFAASGGCARFLRVLDFCTRAVQACCGRMQFVGVGQCGIQVSEQYWRLASVELDAQQSSVPALPRVKAPSVEAKPSGSSSALLAPPAAVPPAPAPTPAPVHHTPLVVPPWASELSEGTPQAGAGSRSRRSSSTVESTPARPRTAVGDEPVAPTAPFYPLFDRSTSKALAMLVDSEPKVRCSEPPCPNVPRRASFEPHSTWLVQVIQAIIEPSSKAYLDAIDAGNCIFEQSGRGNNWAWGFNIGRQHRKSETPLYGKAMNVIRRRVRGSLSEVCPRFVGGWLSEIVTVGVVSDRMIV
jgi:hypothetical protein